MAKRLQELTKLRTYNEKIEQEVTLLFQNLQWSLNFSEKKAMVTCEYDSNHRIPLDNKDCHEAQCHLNKLGYTKEDILLPDPVDSNAPTLVKFSKRETFEIINKAANADPLFKRGEGCWGAEPLSLARLQAVYSSAERAAIHQAVVSSAPFCHDLAELDLPRSQDDKQTGHKKSRLAILAELRDMKRRRAKYRVPPKTRNYSDVLRDVIKTQMDSYGEATKTVIKTEYGPNKYVSQRDDKSNLDPGSLHVIVKSERGSPESHTFNRNSVESNSNSFRSRSRNRRRDEGTKSSFLQRQYKDYSSKDSRNEYDKSHKRGLSRDGRQMQYRSAYNSREKSHDDGENRYKDTWKYKNENYVEKHQRDFSRDSSDRSRDVGHSAKKRYHDYHSSNERNEYYDGNAVIKKKDEIVVKQEKLKDQSKYRHDYDSDDYRDRPRDRAQICNKDKRGKYDFRKTHRPRYSPDDVRGGEKRSPEEDYNRKDRAPKPYKERSEHDRINNKRKHKEEKHSYKHEQEYNTSQSKRRREFSGVAIKQERESP